MTDLPLESHSKPRVLISGCLPPPIGGMATYYQTLLHSSLAENVAYEFVQTSTHERELSSSGRASFNNLRSAVQDCLRFIKAVRSFRPELAHIGTAFGLSFLKHAVCVLAAHWMGCRVLLHPHCSIAVLYTDKSKYWRWFFRQVIRRTNGVLVLSQEWLQLSSLVPGSRVYHLSNPVDTEAYLPIFEQRMTQPHFNNPINIFYLGYLGKAKGSFEIVDAAALIRSRGVEVCIDLVGSELTPGELTLLQERVRAAGLEGVVRLNQPAFGAEKLEYLKRADIFIYPSYHEGVPMAVLEAMACGLPVIATRVGGLPDLVQDGANGILIDPRQPAQLADAICRLVQDASLCQSMGEKSRQFVSEKYSLQRHVSQLVHIYEQVLETDAVG